MNLLLDSPFGKISEAIASLREKKGEEKAALAWIDDAIRLGQGFLVNLQFERILVYQHMVMEGDNKALPKMEAATLVARKYVEKNKLKEWRSRSYRFLGRLYDYKGQFSKAVKAYEIAIPLAKFDPEYVEKGVPRWLELRGFLSYSQIMSGQISDGLSSAKKIFGSYDLDKEALALRKKDYYTWAVWKSGIPIRTINALIDKKYLFNKRQMNEWLGEAERILMPPKGAKVWGDFGIRRDEILALKKKLQEVN